MGKKIDKNLLSLLSNESIVIQIMEILHDDGKISFYDYRNAKIKYEYKQLEKNGVDSVKAKDILSNKYFMSFKNVEKIIYA